MVSRRTVLGGIGASVAAGLAGCLDSVPGVGGSDGGSGSLAGAFLADPDLGGTVDGSGDWTVTTAQANLDYLDVAGLESYGEHVDLAIAEAWARSLANLHAGTGEALESVESGLGCRLTTSFGNGRLMIGHAGHLAGSVDADRYRSLASLGSSGSTYHDWEVFSDGSTDTAIGPPGIATAVDRSLVSLTGETTAADRESFRTGILRHAVDRVEDRPSPPGWVERLVDRCRPLHFATLTHVASPTDDSGGRVTVESWEVTGERTRLRVADATSSAAAFDEEWNRSGAEQTVRALGAESVSTDVGDGWAVVTGTVATEDLPLGSGG